MQASLIKRANGELLRHATVTKPGDLWKDEAPRSSLLRRSSHFGYEGWKLRGVLRNSPKPLPPSPRLWRVLLAFIPVASHGVFGEGE